MYVNRLRVGAGGRDRRIARQASRDTTTSILGSQRLSNGMQAITHQGGHSPQQKLIFRMIIHVVLRPGMQSAMPRFA